MRPRKKHLSTLMLSLCIFSGSLLPGNASASRLAVTDSPSPRMEDKHAGDHTANTARPAKKPRVWSSHPHLGGGPGPPPLKNSRTCLSLAHSRKLLHRNPWHLCRLPK
ncbi:hypothetical protein K2E95_23840 [Pseudomonas sp. ERGC3:01]|nr:hypothetical protein [Pseudomonas sp. ERGC3:01]